MKVQKYAIVDAPFERSSGKHGDVFAGNIVDQRHGARCDHPRETCAGI